MLIEILLIIDIIMLYTNCSHDTSFRDSVPRVKSIVLSRSLKWKLELVIQVPAIVAVTIMTVVRFASYCRLRKQSKVWEYFEFPTENGEFSEKDKKKRKEVFCKLCPKSMNYLGNTTNMLVHLQYNHRSEYLKVKAKAAAAQPRTQFPQVTSIVDRQTSITEAFQHLEPSSTNSKRWKMLNKSVCRCIAKDMLPISIVNNIGFRGMLHTFEPKYVLPDRKTFCQHYISEMYEDENKDC